MKYLQIVWTGVKGNSCYILQNVSDVLLYITELFLAVQYFSVMTWHSTL